MGETILLSWIHRGVLSLVGIVAAILVCLLVPLRGAAEDNEDS
jgi:hypothetical protein